MADYVPFYFAPRSPMLFRIHKSGVATYDGDQSDLVYLCTTTQRLDQLGLPVIVTDRNAAVRFAAFTVDPPKVIVRPEWYF